MMRHTKAKLLTGSSLIAPLFAGMAAGMLLAPAGALAQNVNPGEPFARAPITLAQSAPANVEAAKPEEKAEAKSEEKAEEKKADDKPETANAKPEAPAVTVVAPAGPAADSASKDSASKDNAAKDGTPATAATADPAPAPVAAETKSEPAPAPAAAAETPAAPAAAAPALASADQPVADKIKDLLAARSSKYFDHKGEREGASAFYKERNYAPIWIENGQANARAKAVVAYLKTVDSDGLDPAEYASPEITAGMDAEALANAELKLTDAALTFARHAATGRVSFTRISNDMYYALKFPEPAAILARLTAGGKADEALASYLPQHPAYKALKAKYAEIRNAKNDAKVIRIDTGPTLKLVKVKNELKPMDDPRVPKLRERLGVTQNPASTAYDEDVAEAVKKFQAAHKLNADGILGNATVNAINGPVREKKDDIILVNLERWRWIDHDLRGDTYVMVNIPDYSLKLVRNGEKYWETRIVVGQPSKPTPLISPDMKFITVNPTWNVPPSIIAREYLPALRQDPTVLDRIGLKMTHNPDGTVRIYQPPGERNALGRIRFNFPNKFLVYQHDTPDKNLFAHDKRAYSHGCMRVQNPMTYAEKLLSIQLPNQHYTEAKVKSMLGQNEINIDFPKPLPVHITYQTAFVDDAGNLQFRDDVYGIDARMVKAMKSDERRIADIAVEQKGVGSATVSRDELRYDDPNRGAGFENPFLALFGVRPDPQPEGRNARGDRRYNNRNGREARQNQPPNFFGLFR
ncbi:MAG TPA: L,D-transpeptidase family protein [Xanthobacteraceae bacterium]|nr:L,D-transpeptidase family protein [Xanthobacteraceae bacterium]